MRTYGSDKPVRSFPLETISLRNVESIMMEYLEYFCCPKCGSDLTVSTDAFQCRACSTTYQCFQGIPVLIDLENLPSNFIQQIRYFEREARSDFAETYSLQEWQNSYIQRFTSNFTIRKEQVLIDCGTGSGYMAIELAKRGATVLACDLTLHSLLRLRNIAQQMDLTNIQCVCCSADSLPFRNDSADYFISNAVLEHIPKEEKSIREINRVCKRDAGLMVTVPLSYTYLNPLLLPVNYIHDKRIGHLRRYDVKSLTVKFSGWNFVRIYYSGHFIKVIKVLINLLVKIFDEAKMEHNDREKDNKKWGASNIIVVFNRRITQQSR